MDIIINNRYGTTLKTANKVCNEDIYITIDQDLFEYDTSNEDGLLTRTLSYYFNDRITTLGDRVFQNYATEIELDFPYVESAGANCFYGSTGVAKLNLPRLTSAGSNCFYQMTKLKVLNLPSLNIIASNCCRYSSSLEVFCATSITTIQSAALADCTNLSMIIVGKNASLQNVSAFTRTKIEDGTGFIYVPDEKIEEYKVATNWSTFATQIKGWSEIPQELREELKIW